MFWPVIALFIANLNDVSVTHLGLSLLGDPMAEANPLGRFLWEAGGYFGLWIGKLPTMLVVMLAAETAGLAGRYRLRLLIYAFGCMIPAAASLTWVIPFLG